MNLPNKITTSRFVITFMFVVVMLWDALPYYTSWAALFFLVGGVTDLIDGIIARKYDLKTDFGALMDPLADKVLMSAGFIVMVGMEVNRGTQFGSYNVPTAFAAPGKELLMPAWMVIIIVSRELAITGLRLLAANKQVVLPAENIGKWKTNFQFVAIMSMLILVSYPEWGEGWVQFFGWQIAGVPWSILVTAIATWGAVGLTLASGVHYLWTNRDLYLKDM
tara:strand:+ start:274 stop:936 length:663 start_codon:yes stop_codon:yes gene_type:complete